MKNRHKIIPSSYLIPIKDGKILLARRANTGFEDGNFGLIAGHVEENENFTSGLIREVYEEAGLNLKQENVRLVHIIYRKATHEERIDGFYTCEDWQGEIKNMEPGKCDLMDWFDIDNLPANTIPYVRQAIELGLLKNIFYSEYGY